MDKDVKKLYEDRDAELKETKKEEKKIEKDIQGPRTDEDEKVTFPKEKE